MSWRSFGSTRAPEGAGEAASEAWATATATGRAAEGGAVFLFRFFRHLPIFSFDQLAWGASGGEESGGGWKGGRGGMKKDEDASEDGEGKEVKGGRCSLSFRCYRPCLFLGLSFD